MIPQDLHYLWIGAANLLFFIFLFLALFWMLHLYRHRMGLKLAPESILNAVMVSRSSYIYWVKVVLFCVAWGLIVLALMQPQGNGHYPKGIAPKSSENVLRRKAHEVIFFLDASASMEIKDGRSGQSRLDYAKEIADEVISRLTGETVSLYAFTSEVAKIVPPTQDYLFTRMMLRQIKINEGDVAGTSLSEVFKYLQTHYFSTITPKQKSIIILTDGGDTSLEGLQGTQKTLAEEVLYQLIPNPKTHHLRLFTIGLGSQKGEVVPSMEFEGKPVVSALDVKLLQELATKGKGNFYDANQLSVIDIATDIVNRLEQDEAYIREGQFEGETQNAQLIYDLYFQFPLGLALLLLGFCVFFPNNSQKTTFLLLMFFFTGNGWLRADPFQQASIYYEAGDYKQAQEIYEELSSKSLASWEKQVINYNLGTTLLAQGANEKAVSVFQLIEDQNPLLQMHAKYNLALAQKALAKEIPDQRARRYLLKDAIRNVRLSQQFGCELQKLEGYQTCSTPKKVASLDQLLTKELDEIGVLPIVETKQEEPTSPKEILKNLIDQQQIVLEENLDRLIGQKSSEFLNALLEKQKEILHLSLLFYPSVNHLQKELFVKEGCQCQPWDKVLPLFEKGSDAAFLANQWLKDYPEQSQEKQQEALKFWHEALNQLNAPKQDQTPPPKEQHESEEKLSLDKVKSFLQEMEFDDQMPNKGHERIKQVLKPW